MQVSAITSVAHDPQRNLLFLSGKDWPLCKIRVVYQLFTIRYIQHPHDRMRGSVIWSIELHV
jgi:hypothetical protein